jgi:NAD-dependent DNA ligase (contains BRCT domain type II)
MNNTIKELENKIKLYSDQYYQGESEISDIEFDNLIDQLRELDPNNGILSKTGWGYNPVEYGKPVPHLFKLQGLDKVKCEKSTIINYDYVTPKYDGASVEVIYKNNKFYQAISRGNGTEGFDVTNKLKYIVPNNLYIDDTTNNKSPVDEIFRYTSNEMISISGEFIMDKIIKNKEQYCKAPSARNLATGFLNRKKFNKDECKDYSFIPYRLNGIVVNSDDELNYEHFESLCYNHYKSEIIEYLHNHFVDNGEDCYDYFPTIEKEYISDFEGFFQSTNVEEYFECDGIVVGTDKLDYKIKDNKIYFKYNDIALKVTKDTAEVEVDKITWQLSRTGLLVPVVEIKNPVFLQGATISRVTAFNAKYVKDNRIDKGAILKISRSGDVIPTILEVIKPCDTFETNLACPVCNQKAEWHSVNLVCKNENCKNKSYSDIYRWIELIGAEKGASENIINAIIEYGKLTCISDIYNIMEYNYNWDKLLKDVPCFGKSSIELTKKVWSNLFREIEVHEFLSALNIAGIGLKTAEVLAKECDIYNKVKDVFGKAKLDDITNANGIGESVKSILIKNHNYIRSVFMVCKVIDIKKKEESKDLIKVTLTGKLENYGRNELLEKFKDKIIETSINECDYLVTNTPDSGSSKNVKAQKLGKQIITENKLLEMLGE